MASSSKSKFPQVLQQLFGWTIVLSVVSFWPGDWLAFVLPKLLFLTAGLLLVFCALFWTRRPIGLSKSSMWVFFFFAVNLLFVVFSRAPVASIFGVSGVSLGLQSLLLFFFVFILALHLGEGVFRGKWLLSLNLLVAGYAVLQFLGVDPLQGVWFEEAMLGRSTSFLGNPNWLASVIVLTLPVLFASMKGGLRWLLLLLNVCAIVAAGSKAGFIALVFIVFALLPKRRLAGASILGALFGVSMLFFYGSSWGFIRSMGARMQIWSASVDAIWAWPWGYGLEGFRFAIPRFLSTEFWAVDAMTASVTHAHNFILQLLVELGPLGLFAFFAMLIVLILPQWRNPISTALMAYLITLFFGFEVVPTAVLFWLYLGVLASDERKRWNFPVRWVAGASIGVLSFLLIAFTVQIQAVRDYQEGLEYLSEKEYNLALSSFESSIAHYSFDRVPLLQVSELILSSDDPSEDLLNRAESYLNQVDLISSGLDPELPILRAWLAAKRGRHKEAQEWIQVALEMNPAGATTYKIALTVYKELGLHARYADLKEQFLKRLPEYWSDVQEEAGRIFQKGNAWINSL